MNNSLPGNIPEGFEYYPEFLSVQEESDLLDLISGIELQTFVFQGYTAKRKVASFGLNYSFDSRKVSEGEPMPSEFMSLIDKAAGFVHVPAGAISEIAL